MKIKFKWVFLENSEDIRTSYQFTHIPTNTLLFVRNVFLPAKSSILWVFQYLDDTNSCKIYKRFEQFVQANFYTQENKIYNNVIVTLHSLDPNIPTNITNDVIAEFSSPFATFLP